jgi:antitoxin (DNA-binding transcriptional repressor) of toxin-antitoxin stability system
MTPIDLTDARDRLPELLVRSASGEQFVLTDGGRWAALLAPPPLPPPTAEELAAAQARAEQAVRELMESWKTDPISLPDGMTIDDLLREVRGC